MIAEDPRHPAESPHRKLPSDGRHAVGNLMAATGIITAAVAVVGSFLPWMRYHGGDGPRIVVAGTAGGGLGVWTAVIGLGMIGLSLVSASIRTVGRSALVTAPALCGLALAVLAWRYPVKVGGEGRISGDAAYGLVITAVSFALGLASAAILWRKDQFLWMMDQCRIADRASGSAGVRSGGPLEA